MTDATSVDAINGAQFRAQRVLRPRQQVETQIKRAILDGTFPKGGRLPSETKLAEEFGVSRATVREALRALSESGLIITTPGSAGGSFVQQVDHHALSNVVSDRLIHVLNLGTVTHHEVAAFRDILEVPTVRLAAVHRNAEHLSAIRAIIDDEKRATFDDPAVPELNAQFHCALADASDNRVLSAMVAALHRLAHPLAFIITDPNVGKRAVEHHIDIYKAVEARRPEQAAKVMMAHLEYLNAHAR